MSNDFFRRFRIKSETINPPSLLNYNNNFKNNNYNKKNSYNDYYLQIII
jgi:hypothetical protein